METCQKCMLVQGPAEQMFVYEGVTLCPPCYVVACYKQAGIDVLTQPLYLLDPSTPDQLFKVEYQPSELVWLTCNVRSDTLEFISHEGAYDECEDAVSAGYSWGYTEPWLPKAQPK